MATMLNPNAIPDGSITKEKIDAAVLTTKQDKLTAGNGISIKDNKIGVTAITESESQPSTHLWINPSEDAETGVSYNRSQIDALVGAKQDTINDLADIRSGAAKGATALQRETDPVYLADKPNIALKTEIPDISGKADKATTLAGYGIGDAYTKSEVDTAIASAITTTLNTEV